MNIEGFCDRRFARVRDAFETNFAEHGDVGASFAVTLEGEYVVDIWAGYQDAARSRPWVEDTIINVYSSPILEADPESITGRGKTPVGI